MQQLIGDRPGLLMGTSFLQELFLQRLPHSVRMVLASTPDSTTLDKLAEMADKIMEVSIPPSVSAVAAPTIAAPTVAAPTVAAVGSSPGLATEVEHLRADITRLEKLVRNFALPRSPSRSSFRQSRRSPSPAASTSTDSLCWYHHKFGDQAQRCRSPCTWSGNEQAGH